MYDSTPWGYIHANNRANELGYKSRGLEKEVSLLKETINNLNLKIKELEEEIKILKSGK